MTKHRADLLVGYRKWESCSTSIAKEIDKCDGKDLGCACSHANAGFKYMPTPYAKSQPVKSKAKS